MTTVDAVAVAGGDLAVTRSGRGPVTVVAVHGIAGSHVSWRAMARRLPDAAYTLLAPDLRGRANSEELPGPYGVAAHVDDIRRILHHYDLGDVTVVGHSMGATIAAHVAAQEPDRVSAVVLVDGGLPVPLPADPPPRQVMDAVIAPTLRRLRERHPTAEAHAGVLRGLPEFAGRESDADLAALFEHERGGEPPAVRSRINPEALAREAEDLFTVDEIRLGIRGVKVPVHLLVADHGVRGAPGPLYPEAAIAPFVPAPVGSSETVADTNHFTILLEPAAARIAAAVETLSTPEGISR